MIKIERTEVMNFENAIRGARNPMNSWDLSDSEWQFVEDPSGISRCEELKFIIGEKDLNLAQRLVRAGSDHRKFIRQIFISVDITAPLYWWKEFDTYKVGTVANSCSTMHKIHAKEFELDDFSWEHLGEDVIVNGENLNISLACLRQTISVLNTARQWFVDTKDKTYWWQMIQLLPSSYNQMRTITMNYENALNMYYARRNHKLDEWHTYCDWIETLPYFKEICLGGESND